MSKNLFIIDDSEKIRILEMHINATNKQYLIEQVDLTKDPIYPVFYSKLGDISRRTWDGVEKNVPKMNDDEKSAVLQQVKDRVNKRVTALTNQGKKTDFNNELKSAEKISIRYKTEVKETVPEKQETITIETPYIATYPDNTKQNPDLQNFYFQDNQVEVPEDRVEKFRVMVNELKNAIPKNEVITEIHIKAGSSTSQVPTTYSGGNYKTIEEGQKNNVILAEDRCKKIETILAQIVKEAFPNDYNKLIIDTRDMKPNNSGPDKKSVYTEKERTYFFSTGKLDPAKKTEYDTKYGLYKGSYGSVMIITKGTEVENIPVAGEPIKINQWSVTIQWKVKSGSNQKQKSLFKSSSGGQITIGGGKGMTNCPVW